MPDSLREIIEGIEAESTLHEITREADDCEMWLVLILMESTCE